MPLFLYAQVGNYLRELYKLLDKHNYQMTLFGHIRRWLPAHAHHVQSENRRGREKLSRIHDGSGTRGCTVRRIVSGEHGDGQARAEFLPIMYGSEIIQAFREFKSAWDPEWQMNPGKVIDPYPMDTNLRVGPDYKPKPVLTVFQFPGDQGSFAHATERCFGVGKCRGIERRHHVPKLPCHA